MPLFNLKEKQKKEKPELTNIFEKKKKGKKEKESEIVSGVFAKEEKEKGKEEKILGPLPELEKKIIGAFDPTKRNLKIIRTVFFTLILISLLSIGFFYAELNPEFDLLANVRGPNTAQKLANSEKEIISTQTSINQKNYLLLNYYLKELSYLSDNYQKSRNGKFSPQELVNLQNSILTSYENAQAKWGEPIVIAGIPNETFENELRLTFQNELRELRQEVPSPATESQINDYSSAVKLIGNNRLNSFFAKNPDDIQEDLPRDDTQLFLLTQQVLDILQNEFSHISEIKQNRIQWSVIVNEIERVTKSVDTLYNTGFFEELGGIQYSAYDFDSTNNRIILSGRAKRDDGSTFTLIANLIDALEKSEMFTDVDNRTYPKSGSDEQGYVSTFRIELSLTEQ